MALDPYQVLGLPSGASPAEAKRAYRRLAKLHHPDSAGEGALPRFLEIQRAYEQLTAASWRPGRRRPAASEPWRADPARARSTAGARPPGTQPPGTQPPGTRPPGTRPPGTQPPGTQPPGAGSPGSAGRSSGTAGARGGVGADAGARARRDDDGKSGGTGRRRTSRKATFGSTTYDEAREPADPTWSGAAWYGPTSGEYWQVNPREYADPRRHGPEYQARATQRAAAATQAAGATHAATGPEAATGQEAPTEPEAAAEPVRARATASQPGSSRASAPECDDAPPPMPVAGWGLTTIPPRVRRFVLALVAWPPLGVAAAAAIGGATGCAEFSASCTPPEGLYPWVAQAAILAGLLAVPQAVARVLTGGTVAVALLAVPVAAALTAGGATYDRTYGPASLIAILTLAWAAGVGAMLLRRGGSQPSP